MARLPYGDIRHARDGRFYVTPTYGDTTRFVVPRIVLDSLPRRPRDGEHVQFRAATGRNGRPCAIDVRLPRPSRQYRNDDVAALMHDTGAPSRRGDMFHLGTLAFDRDGRAYVRPDSGRERVFVPGFVWKAVRPRLLPGDRVKFKPDRGRNGAPCTLDVRHA